MKRLYWIILILVSAIALGSSVKPTSTCYNAYEQEAQTALDFVCETLKVDCTGIEPPRVVATGLMEELGLYGLTPKDEPHIFITNADIGPHMTMVVIVHETTHYVLNAVRPDIGFCDSEFIARLTHSIYAEEPYDDGWRKLETYAGCDGAETEDSSSDS